MDEYLRELDSQNTKDARIRREKIRTYVKILKERGLPLPEPLCKHMVDKIYELRPIGDRVFFAGWVDGAYVLLHCYKKQGQKTPPRELKKAQEELPTLWKGGRKMAKVNGFTVWDEEFDSCHFTPEEIAESDLEAELIAALIDARDEQGVSQRALEEMSGVRQPAIARIEKGVNSPTVETMIKLLTPLGKKLAIVPMNSST